MTIPIGRSAAAAIRRTKSTAIRRRQWRASAQGREDRSQAILTPALTAVAPSLNARLIRPRPFPGVLDLTFRYLTPSRLTGVHLAATQTPRCPDAEQAPTTRRQPARHEAQGDHARSQAEQQVPELWSRRGGRFLRPAAAGLARRNTPAGLSALLPKGGGRSVSHFSRRQVRGPPKELYEWSGADAPIVGPDCLGHHPGNCAAGPRTPRPVAAVNERKDNYQGGGGTAGHISRCQLRPTAGQRASLIWRPRRSGRP